MGAVEKAREEKFPEKKIKKKETQDHYEKRMVFYMVIGVIILFSSIGGYIWADSVYYSASVYSTNEFEFQPLEVGSEVNIMLNFTFRKSNSYDIRLVLMADGPVVETTGKFTLEISSSLLSKMDGSISSTYFNGTFFKNHNIRYLEKLTYDISNPAILCRLTEIQDVKELFVHVEIFENPNRGLTYAIYTISGLVTLTGVFLFFGALIKILREDWRET